MNKRTEIIKLLENQRGGVGIKNIAKWTGITLQEAKKHVLNLQIDGLVTVDNRGVALTDNVIKCGKRTYIVTDRGHVAIEMCKNELHQRP